MSTHQEGCVLWFTGLSGAGKTTLATTLYKQLKPSIAPLVLLDGDTLRETFPTELTDPHSPETRRTIAYRNARLCRMLAQQGIHVICATIALFHDVQQWNKQQLANYIEIFVDTPMDVLLQRDQKSLYSGCKEGTIQQVVGVDIPAEFPIQPDVTICNDGSSTPEAIISSLLPQLYPRLKDTYLPPAKTTTKENA